MKFEIIGIDKAIHALDKVFRDIEEDISHEIEGTAERTVSSARARLTPFGNEGQELVAQINSVRSSIGHKIEAHKLEGEVHAGGVKPENIAAYLEFGTGKNAQSYVPSLPSEYRSLAMTFYINGKGRLKTHPFLIPAYLQEKKRLLKRLQGLKVAW